jgi:regulation of enolase protein 1 (concanavalin A-like superfamily)
MKSIIHKTFLLSFLFLAAFVHYAASQKISYGIFKGHSDIGNPKLPGSVIYNPGSEEYIIEGSGYNIWFERDEFHYLWRQVKGDFVLTARIEFIDKGVEPHRKIGWMIRNDLSPTSPHVSAVVHGDGLTSLQYRKTDSAPTEEVKSDDQSPEIIQLERSGNFFSMSTASGNNPFKTVKAENINLNEKVFVGLFVCSHNTDIVEKAYFRKVRISRKSGQNK